MDRGECFSSGRNSGNFSVRPAATAVLFRVIVSGDTPPVEF
jgi:hypothetical protein